MNVPHPPTVFGMAQSNAGGAAFIDIENLKSKVNGLIGDGNDDSITNSTSQSSSGSGSAAQQQLQDGLSCTELFKNGDGLTYK